jgi:hypothetical protein
VIVLRCRVEVHGKGVRRRYDSRVARSHEALWLGASATIAAAAVGLAAANVTFDSVRPHYRFWSTGIMIAAYAVGVLALVCFGGALRGWRMPLAGDRPHRMAATSSPVAPALTSSDAEFAAARRVYLRRVRERFRRIDLEVLTPLTEQDEHPEMLLGEVFVPQLVRADPPPVELPRELWRRLEEGGEISDRDPPEGLDKESITRTGQAYHDRPALPVLNIVAGSGGRKLVLLGDPGAGKSTLARYLILALSSATEDGNDVTGIGREVPGSLRGCLPLLVELRSYADPQWQDRTFLDLIGHLQATEDLGLPAMALDAFFAARWSGAGGIRWAG